MSTEVERLIARLEVQQSQFERQLRRAQQNTNRAARGIEDRFRRTNQTVTAQFATMGTRIATILGGALGIGVGFGVAGITRGIRSAVSDLSALGKEARAASLPVEDLQGLLRGFERSTTVSGDQLTTAFTAFNRRVGEAAQGTGELSRVVKNYGLSLTDANGNLKSQRELLGDIANLIRGAPTDQARAQIAQAAFGRVGPELADALRGGSEALDQMIADARTAGDVIDRDLVQRAEILDDKFDALTRRVGTFFKTLAVGAAGASIETPLDALERLFGSVERARAALGDDLFGALTEDLEKLDQIGASVDRVAGQVSELTAEARSASGEVRAFADDLQAMGATASARLLRNVADDMVLLGAALRDGTITVAEFDEGMEDAAAQAQELVAEIEGVDAASLAGIIARFGALSRSIVNAAAAVQALKAEAGIDAEARGPAPRGARRRVEVRRDATEAFLAEQTRLASRKREEIDLDNELAQVQRQARADGVQLTQAQAQAQARLNLQKKEDVALEARLAAASGSRGGGGGSSRDSDFARAVEAIQERTWALEAEAAALVATAMSGREYADAYEFAMQKARLTVEAQKSGLTITAELEATINRLAEAYVNAGQAAETAAEGMKRTAEQAARGASAISGIFAGVLTGATRAEDAVKSLLQQLVNAQFNNLFMSLASTGAGGGFFSTIARGLGFAQGGYTGDGGKHEPKGVVHGGEYVFSKEAVKRAGVQNLDAMHRQLKGFSAGGYVGQRPAARGMSAPGLQIVDQRSKGSPNLRAEGRMTRDADGRDVFRVLLTEEVGRGTIDKPMGGRYGNKPNPVKR